MFVGWAGSLQSIPRHQAGPPPDDRNARGALLVARYSRGGLADGPVVREGSLHADGTVVLTYSFADTYETTQRERRESD